MSNKSLLTEASFELAIFDTTIQGAVAGNGVKNTRLDPSSLIPRLYLCLVLALSFSASLQAASASEPTLPDNSPAPQTASIEEILSGNPIKITISAGAPSSDLKTINSPLGLDQAIQIALKENLSLLGAEKSWLISKFQARSALSKFGPSASFATFFSHSSIDQMLFFQGEPVVSAPMQPVVRGTSFHFLFAGTQPLFTGGRLLGSYRAARAQERQTLASFRATRLETALKVKEAYWGAAWDKARLKVGSDYTVLKENAAANMKQRVEQGKAPAADYLREEAELARARRELNLLFAAYNLSLLKLKTVLGANLSSQISIADDLIFVPCKRDLDFFLKEAASNRPEIDRAKNKIAEARARHLVAASKYSPQISLYGLSANASGNTGAIDNVVEGRWGASLGIIGGVTLFDSGARLNELRAAAVAVDQSRLAGKETSLAVAAEVASAWINLDLAGRNVELSRQEVASAEEDARLIHMRYLVGKAIALEDFAATLKLLQARLSSIESIYNYRLSEARLTAAAGGI